MMLTSVQLHRHRPQIASTQLQLDLPIAPTNVAYFTDVDLEPGSDSSHGTSSILDIA